MALLSKSPPPHPVRNDQFVLPDCLPHVLCADGPGGGVAACTTVDVECCCMDQQAQAKQTSKHRHRFRSTSEIDEKAHAQVLKHTSATDDQARGYMPSGPCTLLLPRSEKCSVDGMRRDYKMTKQHFVYLSGAAYR